MANLTKTIQTELLAITVVSSATQQISSVLDVATKLATTILIDFAPDSNTAPTQGTEFRVEVSQKASGNDTWMPLVSVVTGIVAAVSGTVQATQNAGSTTITSTGAITSIVQDDIVLLKNATLGNSEWVKVSTVTSSTVFGVVDPTTNAQGSSGIRNKGEKFVIPIDCTAITRIRVVVNNKYKAGTTIAIVARIAAITADSIG